jgi:hypothetical protein
MRDLIRSVMFGGVVLAGCSGWGQMHKVAKPEQVVRAVGVYEWTGDMAKPTASRLIPVSLFMEGRLEDAGVYLARPIPFALLTGNVYELQDAGKARGTLDLVYARHMQAVDRSTGDSAYDDGWFGYGSFQALTAAKKSPALRASKTLPVIATNSGDPDKPHFTRRGGDDTTAGAGSDPSKTKGDAGSGGSGAADDPDRPTFKRRPADSAGASTTADAGAGSMPADDPDRPTLKRHSVEDAKKAKPAGDDVASVTAKASLNDDPNRPRLHYGKPASAMTEADLPKLKGLPPDLHQMVAVSDAANREPHEFARTWADAEERAAVLQKMEGMARAQLAAYGGTPGAAAMPAAPAVKPRTATSRSRHAAAVPVAAPVALMDEVLKGYTLSYGGDPTYVYMAHTAGSGAALRYVTVVAQTDEMGQFKAAMQSVTDAAHLDRTPRMKFVDVVDAQASNRASLLFELRWQSSRQFALYRVIAAKADQIFLSGTTQ